MVGFVGQIVAAHIELHVNRVWRGEGSLGAF